MNLEDFSNPGFHRGRSKSVELVWTLVSGLAFSSWIPGSRWRCFLLRRFGADIGTGVVIKPGVRVKFPWKLRVGDHSWIGESVWIDNLDEVIIGSNCCISQGAYFCTGSHRWDKESFDLVTKPIVVEDCCWIAAMVKLAPGVIVRRRAVLGFGVQASGEYREATIFLQESSGLREVDRE